MALIESVLLALSLHLSVRLSDAQCNVCPTNPCPTGAPLAGNNGAWFTCDYRNQNSCPSGFWCHTGYSRLTTACCPISSDANACTAPVNIGQGAFQMNRWFFETSSRQCRPFVYRGIRGNQNNFVTRAHCQSICPEKTNPCCCGEPVVNAATNDWQTCNTVGTSQCPAGSWCHVGATAETSTCCPGAVPDPCLTARVPGIGSSQLQRWYFDAATLTCRSFSYNGLRGQQNNFLSLQQCEGSCNVFKNPCPTDMLQVQPMYCRANSRTCPIGTWCHIGAGAETTVCCPQLLSPVCDQPRAEGDGTSSLTRWYVDKTMGLCGECRQFTYSGTRGNQNNYLTKQECDAACPSCVNPCASGTPLLDANRRPMSCSAFGQCPNNYWCHTGADAASTVCCPGKTDSPCQLPQLIGSGQAQLSRWYFDRTTGLCGQCRQFLYSGLKGNQNNFLSQSACEAACPSCQNPCLGGTPLLGADGRPQQCSVNRQCSASYWCHIGATMDTTVCCPTTPGANVCQMSLTIGTGTASLSRWYVDSTVGLCGTCRQFTYRGLLGNMNNFLTQQDCEAACPSCVNPCNVGQPIFESSTNRPVLCSPLNPCPATHWCHVGDRAETTMCCASSGDVCTLPRTVGTGSAGLQRWYYDGTQRQCLPFVYNGLKGTQNMFLSKTDCESIGCPLWTNACSTGQPILDGVFPRVCNANNLCPNGYWCHIGPIDGNVTQCCPNNGQTPCQQQVAYGTGDYSIPRYYYDSATRTCRAFSYRGIRGNSNNFLTERDCADTCPVYENACSTGLPQLEGNGRPSQCRQTNQCQPGYWCHVGATDEATMCCPNAADPCTQRMAAGDSGRNGPPLQVVRWYYDSQYQICRRFDYNGFRGNQNNFLVRQDCQTVCPEVNVCGTGQPLLDPTNNPVTCVPGSPTSCPSTHFCHEGNFAIGEFTSTVCCPTAGNVCDQALIEGRVLGTPTQRWYYQKSTDECRQFQYGGMQGNQNNFRSQVQCEEACPGLRNLCPHGRPLISLTVPQTCSVENLCAEGYICNVGLSVNDAVVSQGQNTQGGVCCPDPLNFCFQQRDPGTCNIFERRYGYDPNTNTCISYQYGGCGGTLNNFRDLQRCTEICCDNFQRKKYALLSKKRR